jgi:hypothetical protein
MGYRIGHAAIGNNIQEPTILTVPFLRISSAIKLNETVAGKAVNLHSGDQLRNIDMLRMHCINMYKTIPISLSFFHSISAQSTAPGVCIPELREVATLLRLLQPTLPTSSHARISGIPLRARQAFKETCA